MTLAKRNLSDTSRHNYKLTGLLSKHITNVTGYWRTQVREVELEAEEQSVQLNQMNKAYCPSCEHLWVWAHRRSAGARPRPWSQSTSERDSRGRTATLASGSNQPSLVCRPLVGRAAWVHARTGPARPPSKRQVGRRHSVPGGNYPASVNEQRSVLELQRTQASRMSPESGPPTSTKTWHSGYACGASFVFAPYSS